MPKAILIVDDDESYGAYLSSLLQRHAFVPQHVTSAQRALELLQSVRFDAVVTDIYMPECDGIELLQLVNKHHQGLPVVGMTGDDSELTSIIERIFRYSGGFAMVHKPVCVTELIAILTTLPSAAS